MINQVRISKYDPIFRIDGAYIKDEWTSFSDIGHVFGGIPLQEEEYLLIERAYIQCIIELFQVSNGQKLRIDGLERNILMFRWRNNQAMSTAKTEQFIKDCLREKCWGRLSSQNFFIHFGYDYYVYIGCDLPYEDIARIISKNGLFMEIMNSPYSINFR